jgi:hypothetical protein
MRLFLNDGREGFGAHYERRRAAHMQVPCVGNSQEPSSVIEQLKDPNSR